MKGRKGSEVVLGDLGGSNASRSDCKSFEKVPSGEEEGGGRTGREVGPNRKEEREGFKGSRLAGGVENVVGGSCGVCGSREERSKRRGRGLKDECDELAASRIPFPMLDIPSAPSLPPTTLVNNSLDSLCFVLDALQLSFLLSPPPDKPTFSFQLPPLACILTLSDPDAAVLVE